MSCHLPPNRIQEAIAFHGHECPGLWIGIRAAELCLARLGHNDQEPLIAVTETDMCGVDAIQVLTGCTFGKGNLIHRDYGKMAFSFYRKSDGQGFRAVFPQQALDPVGEEMRLLTKKIFAGQATDEEKKQFETLRDEARRLIFAAPFEKLFSLTEALPAPRPARILDSLVCAGCKESVMESRTRRFDGATYCIPCFATIEQKV